MDCVGNGCHAAIYQHTEERAIMNYDEEEFSPFGGFGNGCDLHGEDFLRECTMCGIEFCSACIPHSTLCADCAAQAEFEDEDEDEPTDEEKDLLLLEGFNDDEPELGEEDPSAFALPLPPKTSAAASKATPKAEPKKSAAKSKATAKPKAKPAAKSKRKG